MKTKEWGILCTLLGGVLWGFSGTCGQYLYQHKEMTSDWLVPWRLTCSGLLILLFLAATQGREVLAVWKEQRGRRDILTAKVKALVQHRNRVLP